MLQKQEKRKRRHQRIRKKIKGTAERPRLCVFRSNKHIYAQIINDEVGEVIAAAKDMDLSKKEREIKEENRKVELARKVGRLVAKKAKKKGVERVVFDRAGYKFHGRVKAVAEGAREEKLKL